MNRIYWTYYYDPDTYKGDKKWHGHIEHPRGPELYNPETIGDDRALKKGIQILFVDENDLTEKEIREMEN